MAIKIPFKRTGNKEVDRDMVVIEQAISKLESFVAGLNRSTKFTELGGLAIKVKNITGSNSVKGSLLSVSQGTDNAVILQSNEYDTVGIALEDGVPSGSYMWMVVSGIAEILIENGAGTTRGQIAIAAPTDGRAKGVANPGSGLPATDTHFKEVGHIMESKSAATDLLVKAMIHFN